MHKLVNICGHIDLSIIYLYNFLKIMNVIVTILFSYERKYMLKLAVAANYIQQP